MTGLELKIKRIKKELKISELSEKTGVSANTISRIENGKPFFSTTIEKLLKVLDE